MTAETEPLPSGATLPEIVRTRIAAGLPIRRTIAGGGRLHVDRPLPFLCLYRTPPRPDPGTADLVRTQASYLVAPAALGSVAALAPLVDGIVAALARACGACLVLEVWSGEDAAGPVRIHAAAGDLLATTVAAFATALRDMAIFSTRLEVEVVAAAAAPTGMEPVFSGEQAPHGVLWIGLELPPMYRSTGAVYPAVLRAMTSELAHALQRGFFEFTRVQTPARPEHFHVLGRRRLVRAVRSTDAALAAIDTSFDFLLAVTPVNLDAAWSEFSASGGRGTPSFRYRMLQVDPDLGKRQLYDLPIERLEDPVLALLLRDKRRELDRQLGMLDDRDTPRFRSGGLQLYGAVDDAEVAIAESILARFPTSPPREPTGARVRAAELAARARAELDLYRAQLRELAATVEIQDDLVSVMVSNGNLLVPANLDMAARRVDALLAHEIGTHAVTFANGSVQPLRILASGLAGYEAMQEGLAMFAEFLAGGLDADRLRLVAVRAIAVRRMLDGAAFPEVVAELAERWKLTARAAFMTVVRVFRGGGLAKDAIYLRGLVDLLGYLRAGGALEPLLVGKIALAQVPLIQELLARGVLRPPVLVPRWLSGERAAERLERARAGLTPTDLVEGTA